MCYSSVKDLSSQFEAVKDVIEVNNRSVNQLQYEKFLEKTSLDSMQAQDLAKAKSIFKYIIDNEPLIDEYIAIIRGQANSRELERYFFSKIFKDKKVKIENISKKDFVTAVKCCVSFPNGTSESNLIKMYDRMKNF